MGPNRVKENYYQGGHVGLFMLCTSSRDLALASCKIWTFYELKILKHVLNVLNCLYLLLKYDGRRPIKQWKITSKTIFLWNLDREGI